MAKKIVIRSDNDEVWVIDLDTGPEPTIRELVDEDPDYELTKMIDSLADLDPEMQGLHNAVMGVDITEYDPASGNEHYSG